MQRYAGESLAAWLLVLCLIGYAPVGLVGSLFNLPREFTSIPFRVLVIAIAYCVFLVRAFNFQRWVRLRWLLAFWFAYSLRLWWDWEHDVWAINDAIIFFVGTTFIPCIVLGLCEITPRLVELVAKRTAVLGVIFCVLALLMHFAGFGRGAEEQSELTGGRLSIDTVNVLSVGTTAATTVVVLLYLARHRLAFGSAFLMLCAMVASMGALLVSGARAPVLSLAACIPLYWVKGGRMRWIFVGLLAAVPLAFYSVTIERFSWLSGDIEEEPSALSRLVTQYAAMEHFVESPVLGDAYIETETENYPHNVFIEALMALGVVGLGLMLIVFWQAWKRTRALLAEGNLLIPLLMVDYFVAVQLSGSFYGNQAFWALVAITLAKKI